MLVHDFQGLKPVCSLRCPSIIGATYVSSLYMWHSSDIGLYGVSMALNIDCLHNLGTLFSVKHLLSISSTSYAKLDLNYVAV